MKRMQWPVGDAHAGARRGERPFSEELRRVAGGDMPLCDAFQTIAWYGEGLAKAAADLREREIWAATVLIDASGVVWPHLANGTLHFDLDTPCEPGQYHIELGLFPHLAELTAPTAEELALMAATTPCWARVFPHHERQSAGRAGALACCYERMSVAEAVDTLGLATILTMIDAATREVGRDLMAVAQAQRERYDRLQAVEQLLHWEPAVGDAPGFGATAGQRRKVRVLLEFVLYMWRCMTRSGGRL